MSHLLDPAALAARWSYTPRAIYDWLQHHPDRLPPCLRLGSGRTVRFRIEDVEAFERARVQVAAARPRPRRGRGRPRIVACDDVNTAQLLNTSDVEAFERARIQVAAARPRLRRGRGRPRIVTLDNMNATQSLNTSSVEEARG